MSRFWDNIYLNQVMELLDHKSELTDVEMEEINYSTRKVQGQIL